MDLVKYLQKLKKKHPDLVERIENLRSVEPNKNLVNFKFLFKFPDSENCEEFWCRLYHPESLEELISPYEEKDGFYVGYTGETPIDEFRIFTMYDCWLSICIENNGVLKEFSFG